MGQLDLILLRHGQAEDPVLGLGDHARRLTSTGRDEVFKTAKGLITRSLEPSWILCSDAQRTRETADQLTQALGENSPTVIIEPGLYHGSRQGVASLLEHHVGDRRRVLVIGHNPSLSRLAAHLSGEPVQLETGEAVHLTFDLEDSHNPLKDPWRDALASTGVWSLRSLWRR